MTDEVHDLATIEGCITWTHLDKERRAPVMAELRQLRAIEVAARVVAAATPRPKPYYGSAIWELDQLLGPSEDAALAGA